MPNLDKLLSLFAEGQSGEREVAQGVGRRPEVLVEETKDIGGGEVDGVSLRSTRAKWMRSYYPADDEDELDPVTDFE